MFRLTLLYFLVFITAYVVAEDEKIMSGLPESYWKSRKSAAEKCRTEKYPNTTQADLDAFVYHRSAANFQAWCMAGCAGKVFNYLTKDNKYGLDGLMDRIKLQHKSEPELTDKRKAVIMACAEEITTPDPDECKLAQKILSCTGAKSVGFKLVTPLEKDL